MHRFLLILLFPCAVQAQAPKDVLAPVYRQHLEGYPAERLNAAYEHRILAQDVDKLIAPFNDRHEDRCWQSEFWGKWFTSAVLAYRYRPEPKLKALLDKAVAGLLASQSADGYIGNYAPDKHLQQWDVWGRKYCMLGLLSWYDLTGNKAALHAAGRAADHLVKELQERNMLLVKAGNHRGMAATSVLEPIVLLYQRTKQQKYLDFAETIVQQWEQPEGPQLIGKSTVNVAQRWPQPGPGKWFGWDQGQKAYEMMSCYEGLLELYRITGNARYRQAVALTWENIRQTEINIAGSGSAMECWFGGAARQTLPMKHYQETCVTATWIKLSQQLLRLTGDAKYADAIEISFYNALLGAMSADGSDWAKYTPLAGLRMEGSEQCHMGINCCVASGPRGLFTLPSTAVMTEGSGARINFYLPGSYEVNNTTITQQTTYPADSTITITVKPRKATRFPIKLRIPAWSSQSTLTVNGEPVQAIKAGEYVSIDRTWQPGDQLKLTLDMRGRLHRQNHHIAITRGPIVLTRDARLGGPDNSMPVTPVVNKQGYVDLTPVRGATWLQLKAPFIMESYKEGGSGTTTLTLCDYASAGNTQSEASRFRVWLPVLVDPAKAE
ncbi:glycoside hydrolase family 127 protein [Chitinophaga horti]|uniref:Glycoside hydrolase family 127 protein n=1 Tax=Chitinophaga horti TaxID=2920382 RepID=A0ABY6J4N3_9BACT|nr:glycoside hydrolase family 127 protein [Chitinophaga horti]UYQ94558.1 glycoside hydrolase family 127 protein [Chitinophaga horti]